jgi:hypothetical protein
MLSIQETEVHLLQLTLTLKVFQRRSLKAKDAENLQSQIIDILDKDKKDEKPLQPPPVAAKNADKLATPIINPEKPKLAASKSLGFALAADKGSSQALAQPAAGPMVRAPSVHVSAVAPAVVQSQSQGQAQNQNNQSQPKSEDVPEWKKIAQLRKEKREQNEMLSTRIDAELDVRVL